MPLVGGRGVYIYHIHATVKINLLFYITSCVLLLAKGLWWLVQHFLCSSVVMLSLLLSTSLSSSFLYFQPSELIVTFSRCSVPFLSNLECLALLLTIVIKITAETEQQLIVLMVYIQTANLLV